jgi:hypothetical protein
VAPRCYPLHGYGLLGAVVFHSSNDSVCENGILWILARLGHSLPWPPHIWIRVSVESNDYAWRADYLRQVPAGLVQIERGFHAGSLSHLLNSEQFLSDTTDIRP